MNRIFILINIRNQKIAKALLILSIPLQVLGAETKDVVITETKTINSPNIYASKSEPLIIESQVKGSQEQPKVIYIMPWQGIENPIIIDGDKQKITMPDFRPINPKIFKKQSSFFYRSNLKRNEKNSK